MPTNPPSSTPLDLVNEMEMVARLVRSDSYGNVRAIATRIESWVERLRAVSPSPSRPCQTCHGRGWVTRSETHDHGVMPDGSRLGTVGVWNEPCPDCTSAVSPSPSETPPWPIDHVLNGWLEIAGEIERAREVATLAFDDLFPDWFWPRVQQLMSARAASADPPTPHGWQQLLRDARTTLLETRYEFDSDHQIAMRIVARIDNALLPAAPAR